MSEIILYNITMKNIKNKERKICFYCGTKRYIENLYFMNHKNGDQYSCKNNDMCVLKMAYNKKTKCKTKKQ
jgi:hypothetical protein